MFTVFSKTFLKKVEKFLDVFHEKKKKIINEILPKMEESLMEFWYMYGRLPKIKN